MKLNNIPRTATVKMAEMDAIVEELFPANAQKPQMTVRQKWRQYQDRGEEILVSDE